MNCINLAMIWHRPAAREQLITHMDWEEDFSAYRINHNSTVSVNWTFALSDILSTDEGDTVILSPQFFQHIRSLENWSVGPELATALPYLQCIPLHRV